ncbi:MAG TPA: hypothetical protein VF767_00965 [Bryobacteraceae bacterium]
MALQLYAIYTRCNHCGVYDRNPQWCVLCGRAKDGSAGLAPAPPVKPEARRPAPKARTAKKKRSAPPAKARAKVRKVQPPKHKRRAPPAKAKPKARKARPSRKKKTRRR